MERGFGGVDGGGWVCWVGELEHKRGWKSWRGVRRGSQGYAWRTKVEMGIGVGK